MTTYDYTNSKAFVKTFEIEPKDHGDLEGLHFAVKDLIDIAGEVTACGNPTWGQQHPPAASHAICVEQLLHAGATCIGKTITDEFGFSLMGENHFYGTPINPKARDRVPGGSSSGSATAVACGLADFALGTDTGGSIRVPASNCGIWGYRPSFGHISFAGVIPFAPSFDTVGVLAKDFSTLQKVVSVLLGESISESATRFEFMILEDALDICDEEVKSVCTPFFEKISKWKNVAKTELLQLTQQSVGYVDLAELLCNLHWVEAWDQFGTWIEAEKPELGPDTDYNFNRLAKNVDRSRLQNNIETRELIAHAINSYLSKNKILCFPTIPKLPPRLNRVSYTVGENALGEYYPNVLGFMAMAGFSRAPQITMPLLNVNGIPLGISLMAGYGQDEKLLRACSAFLKALA